MTTLLTSKLEVQPERASVGSPILVRMTITNASDQSLEIVNPEVGIPPPELNWEFSDAAYRIGVLMSFGLLKVTLKDAAGRLVEGKGLMPWVTPLLSKLTLQPHDNVVLNFDLNELFSIDSPGFYPLQVRLGSDALYAEAGADIEIKQRSM